MDFDFNSLSTSMGRAYTSPTPNTVANDVMMTAGEVKFSITTLAYQELVKTHSWTWSPINRFGQYASLQFTGADNPTIRLTGTVYPEFANVGINQIEQLVTLGNKAEPFLLTSGLGDVMGYWCLTNVTETQPRHMKAGVPKKQQFSADLIFYGKTLSHSGR
ncbi:phage tail protein [Vibrio sp. V39_P1S14PM300]|uniref:phage tail protein n=1 Tax=Vibrio sp. V39_P1S14PM300 TaxID=1938690 RepID=UPI0013731656|nr:phage tail protein [Vibrio sp. V39_P1S14PM300]NAX21015.1 hypothetical protein [Vibrio sp. V39_P1S14PM300]